MANKIDNTLEDRGKSYGDFSKMSTTSQLLKRVFQKGDAYSEGMPAYMREALDLIAMKIARIVDGDPYHEDSWHDIVGYATLARDRVREELESGADAEDGPWAPGWKGRTEARMQMPIIKPVCTCNARSGEPHWVVCPMNGTKP